jgi:chromosome segregation ATPase
MERAELEDYSKTTINKLVNTNDHLNKCIEELNENINIKNKQIVEYQKVSESTNAFIDKLVARKSRLISKIKSNREEIKFLRTGVSDRSNSIRQLKKELNEANQRCETSKMRRNTISNMLTSTLAIVEDKERAIKALKAQMTNLVENDDPLTDEVVKLRRLKKRLGDQLRSCTRNLRYLQKKELETRNHAKKDEQKFHSNMEKMQVIIWGKDKEITELKEELALTDTMEKVEYHRDNQRLFDMVENLIVIIGRNTNNQ